MLASSNECLLINKNNLVSNLDKMKNSSVKDLLVILQKQIDSKAQLEEMLLLVSRILLNIENHTFKKKLFGCEKLQDQNTNLQMEISSLKSENMSLKSKIDEQQQKLIGRTTTTTMMNDETSMGSESCLVGGVSGSGSASLNRTSTNLDDEKALEIIELTLLKYQNFLDFLRNTGFGKLIELGEFNQQRQLQKQQQRQQLVQQNQHKQALSKNTTKSGTASSYETNRAAGNSNEDYELAYLAAKMLMATDRANRDMSVSDETIGVDDLKNFTSGDFNKFDLTPSMYMHEASLDSNFDADGNTNHQNIQIFYYFSNLSK